MSRKIPPPVIYSVDIKMNSIEIVPKIKTSSYEMHTLETYFQRHHTIKIVQMSSSNMCDASV